MGMHGHAWPAWACMGKMGMMLTKQSNVAAKCKSLTAGNSLSAKLQIVIDTDHLDKTLFTNKKNMHRICTWRRGRKRVKVEGSGVSAGG